jgi:hypothetical protein
MRTQEYVTVYRIIHWHMVVHSRVLEPVNLENINEPILYLNSMGTNPDSSKVVSRNTV